MVAQDDRRSSWTYNQCLDLRTSKIGVLGQDATENNLDSLGSSESVFCILAIQLLLLVVYILHQLRIAVGRRDNQF